jgi:hypothetical protein
MQFSLVTSAFQPGHFEQLCLMAMTVRAAPEIPDKADLHHIVLQKDLLSRLLTLLFGDAARLDTVNLSLIHFD